MQRFAFCYHNGLGCIMSPLQQMIAYIWCYQHFWTTILRCWAQIPSYHLFLYLGLFSVWISSPLGVSQDFWGPNQSLTLILLMTPVIASGWPRDTIVYKSTFPATKPHLHDYQSSLQDYFFKSSAKWPAAHFFSSFSLQWILQAEVSPSDSVALTDHYVLNYKLG